MDATPTLYAVRSCRIFANRRRHHRRTVLTRRAKLRQVRQVAFSDRAPRRRKERPTPTALGEGGFPHGGSNTRVEPAREAPSAALWRRNLCRTIDCFCDGISDALEHGALR